MGKRSKRREHHDDEQDGGYDYYVYTDADEEPPRWSMQEFVSRWATRAMTVGLIVAALLSHSLASLFPTKAESERRRAYKAGASAAGADPGAGGSGFAPNAPPPPPVDHYAVLGLTKSESLTEAEVRTAFRKLSLTCHPDKCVIMPNRRASPARFSADAEKL